MAGRGRVGHRLGCLALGDSSRVLMMAVNKGAGGRRELYPLGAQTLNGGKGESRPWVEAGGLTCDPGKGGLEPRIGVGGSRVLHPLGA